MRIPQAGERRDLALARRLAWGMHGVCMGGGKLMQHVPWPSQIPEGMKIDTEEPLLGSMKPYKRHVLFMAEGKPTSWPPKLVEKEGTVAFEVSPSCSRARLSALLPACVDEESAAPIPCPSNCRPAPGRTHDFFLVHTHTHTCS
jgi:hypothetical protein